MPEFPGTWMAPSETLVYRVIPKCACSTVGQLLFHGDHGRFFDGDIHDAREGLWKWHGNPDEAEARARIAAAVTGGRVPVFTVVRNPWTRVLSAYFDKICGVQRNGRRYRQEVLPDLLSRYGIRPGEDGFDQIAGFRRFLLLVRDTVKFGRPIPADIHWAPQAGHAATLVRNGGRYDMVLSVETLDAGLARLMPHLPHPPESLPRFNESAAHGPQRAHPVEAYFDDLACHIMLDVYARDFRVFGYATEPGSGGPLRPLDPQRITARLGRQPVAA